MMIVITANNDKTMAIVNSSDTDGAGVREGFLIQLMDTQDGNPPSLQ